MQNQLSIFMQDLPQPVHDVESAIQLNGKFEDVPRLAFGWRGTIGKAVRYIEPGELLYILDWATTCTVTDMARGRSHKTHGVSFFTTRRFFYYENEANIVQFPLGDICSVAAHKGILFSGISFRTPALDVALTFNYVSKAVINLVRDMIIHIAANPQLMSSGGEFHAVPGRAVECSACGATVIIRTGAVGKCEYCSRYVEEPQGPLRPAGLPHDMPPAQTGSVADELMKYNELLSMGAISPDEYEAIKNKLLNRL